MKEPQAGASFGPGSREPSQSALSRPQAASIHSRGVPVTLTPRLLEDLALAVSLVRISEGWGHGPGGGPGERMAGFYYRNEVAKKEQVYPAHCMGGVRDLVLILDRLVRDSNSGSQSENSRSEVEAAGSQSGGSASERIAQPSPPETE